MKLSIITPVYNNINYNNYIINSFSSFKDIELIIIDNASKDATKDLQSTDNVKIIRNQENKGFGYACNQGYAQAKSDTILFLNNDIKISDKTMVWLYEYIDFVKDNMLVGPTGGFVDPNSNFDFKYETSDPNKKYNYMSGWFLMGKKSTFDKLIPENCIGPFDCIKYFAYFEDVHLSFEARKLGIQFVLKPIPVMHFGKQTSSKLNISDIYTKSKSTFVKHWKK